jgi:hypothetical protein
MFLEHIKYAACQSNCASEQLTVIQDIVGVVETRNSPVPLQ